MCYPRIEAGQPTVCSETCVGRIRYLGVVLYDADRIEEAASAKDEQDLYEAQLSIFLDPKDPKVIAQARADGIAENWLDGALRSPIWKMAMEWKVAFRSGCRESIESLPSRLVPLLASALPQFGSYCRHRPGTAKDILPPPTVS